MEKIDILLKAMLEIKDQLTILDYKIDNLEAKIDEISSLKVKGDDDQATESQSNEEWQTGEDESLTKEEPEQNDDLVLGGEPDNDPVEKSDDEIVNEINADRSEIFKNGLIDEDKLLKALQIESAKKKEASAKTIDTIEEIKKRQQSVKQFSELEYDITKHLNM